MKKTTAEKIESAKSKLESNRVELKRLRKRTYLYFVGEYRKKYPRQTPDLCGYDMLSYDYADEHQKQNTERIVCISSSMNNHCRDLKKWRGLLDA